VELKALSSSKSGAFSAAKQSQSLKRNWDKLLHRQPAILHLKGRFYEGIKRLEMEALTEELKA